MSGMYRLITSHAAPDDDTLAQCLGVWQPEGEEDTSLYMGEMG